METDTRYNGWTNYETWNIKLWLDNEEPSQQYWNETAAVTWEDADNDYPHHTRSQAARYKLAETLRDEITESAPDLGASMFADLLGAALQDVNWDEIANALLDDIEAFEDETYESHDFSPVV